MKPVTEKNPTNTAPLDGTIPPFLASLLRRDPARWWDAVDVFRKLVSGEDSNEFPSQSLRPLQLEIHPGTYCWCKCPHCCGAGLQCKVQRTLPIDPILRLISKLHAHGTKRIEYAGVFTDPLTWPRLEKAIEHCHSLDLSVGIHTKFIKASSALIETMAATQANNSNIAVSIDYFDRKIYNERLRPAVPNALQNAQANVERLCAEVCETGSPFYVSIRTLIVNGVTTDGLRRGADWIYGLRSKYPECRLGWRISSPWIPASAPAQQQKRISERIDVRGSQAREEIDDCITEILDASESWPGRGKVALRDEPTLSPGDCQKCLNQLLYGNIGSTGGYYPCQSCAAPKYEGISYGNIHNNDDFLECWRRRTLNDLMSIRPGIDCAGCGAPHEAAVNRAGIEALNHDRKTI